MAGSADGEYVFELETETEDLSAASVVEQNLLLHNLGDEGK